jgi:RHH-type proline utilization regulon transcriptional repressor/proline dehydrogenase/delta 1-pyrroline-5-carboxylate dehydrogenase
VWTPRGVGVAIAPWNFPLAILCGLTVAPLVAGNAVIMKPAEQTTVIAAALMDILVEAGSRPASSTSCPGMGEDVGARLVATRQTSSPSPDRAPSASDLGDRRQDAARPGNLKKVVCEMGGKNALIIDNDADLDEAIPAALYSAFGFSGQKCSALSRLIVLEDVHDHFVERFRAACSSIPVGDPASPGTVVGPVIDAESRTKILGMIEKGRKEAKLAFQSKLPTRSRRTATYVPPTVFTGVPASASIARDEIFGPVIAILKAKDLDEAFSMATDVDYALTGGIFSRSPSALERAQNEFLVGNLYSTGGSRAPSSSAIPSAGSRCQAAAARPGARATWRTSCSRARSRRTSCAAASRRPPRRRRARSLYRGGR